MLSKLTPLFVGTAGQFLRRSDANQVARLSPLPQEGDRHQYVGVPDFKVGGDLAVTRCAGLGNRRSHVGDRANREGFPDQALGVAGQ